MGFIPGKYLNDMTVCPRWCYLTRPHQEMPPGVLLDLFVEACLNFCGKKPTEYNNLEAKEIHIPKGACIPRNQVAGHKHEGRSKLGLLEHEDGLILKALQKPPRGTRELHFYEKIFHKDCSDKHIRELQQFLPHFYGAFHFEEYPEVTYIKLENLVSKYRKPCVVDIKMGKKTYDPEAGPAKMAREMTKFPHVEKFGFQFTGMQTYNPVEDNTKFYDKFFCRKLGEDELTVKGLGTYFNFKHGLRKDAIQVLLKKLYTIREWFKSQRLFNFYASSLLMVYEGDTQENNFYTPCNDCDNSDCGYSTADSLQTDSENFSSAADSSSSSTVIDNGDTNSAVTASSEQADTASSGVDSSGQVDDLSSTASVSDISVDTSSPSHRSSLNSHDAVLADVRMIDFTHVFFVDEEDDNYLYGLNNLIYNMENLLKMSV